MDEKDNKDIKPETKIKADDKVKTSVKKPNAPIIISAVFCGFLIILAVVLILVFGKKAEEVIDPDEPTAESLITYSIGRVYGYGRLDDVNKTIIRTDDDLEDLYIRLVEENLTNARDLYTLYEDDVNGNKDKNTSLDNELTYCDWLKIYGSDAEYKEACMSEEDYSWFRWSYCQGEIQTDVAPDFSCDNYLEDYLEYFGFNNPSKINKRYFKDHDLLVFLFDNEGNCGQTFRESRITKKGNKATVKIDYYSPCNSGSCAMFEDLILIELDKDYISKSDKIEFTYSNKSTEDCGNSLFPIEEKKPIIYFYPEQEEKITVKLGRPERLTTTYPKYNKKTGWKVVASPNGTLKEQGSSREYYGLYWEGISSLEEKEDGFVVAGEDTIDFLEEKLSILGLSEREANEFIIYWLPKMEHNKYNYIRFATSEEINSEMPLEISPAPKTLIRVLMEFKPLDEKIEVKEQKLEKVERKGYTVVEWGGTELK